MSRYRHAAVGGCLQADVVQRADGSLLLRSTEPLQAYPERMSDCLAHWAQHASDRAFAAQRDDTGAWQPISYALMLQRAQALGQALVGMNLSAERPILILSDNDLDHLTLMMAAMWVGVPTVTVSSAYSLVSTDFARLRFIVGQCAPGLVFAADARFGAAIDATVPSDVPVVLGHRELASLLATTPGPEVAAAHDATNADTIVKLMYTSGSTRQPKGVPVTHRMWCANQQQTLQCLRFLADEPPVVVDWLPWSHTFGSNHNLGIVLYNGGTLHIDTGRPTPQGMAETLRNLREIASTVYFNVPRGYDELVAAMAQDDALRDRFFSRLQAFECGGAGLSASTLDAMNALAEAAVGERIKLVAGLGMTETAPTCTFAVQDPARAGFIGLPVPGVEVKLVPAGDKLEVRFRGPNVMAGYWRDAATSAAAFDEEGFYRTGDAARPLDAADPSLGLMFDGRIAEDFKLSTGTFVSVGPLRARVIALGFPCVQDVVVTGLNRGDIGLLIFPRFAELQRLAGLDMPVQELLRHAAVRSFFQRLVDQLWREGTGSANRPARLHLLAEPASLDHGELTDKGSINQRAVLTRRADLVERLHDADPTLDVIRPAH